MDTGTLTTLVIKLASSGGTVYALAAFGVSAILAVTLGLKIYRETKKDADKKQAWKDFETASKSGDVALLNDAITRLRNLQK